MSNIHDIVTGINAYVRSLPWCDFEILEMAGAKLVLQGSVSASYLFCIKIIFHGVFYVQCNNDWKVDTSRDVIMVIQDEDARALNSRYRAEIGSYLFRIVAEDIESWFYVIARDVCYETASEPQP